MSSIGVSSHAWPDGIDLAVLAGFLGLVVFVPALGYVFMALDVRRYLRSLRRGLMLVSHGSFGVPDWAQQETPRAVAALGLRMPCTVEELKRAYRRRVKEFHPDRGGDERRFLLLQANFEEALTIVSKREEDLAAWTSRAA